MKKWGIQFQIRTVINPANQNVFGLVEKTFGPLHVSYSRGGHLSKNKFIRKILLVVHLIKCLYLGCFRSNLDKILQRHCGMREGCFLIWYTLLYSNALSHSCTELGNCDFVSKCLRKE